MAARERGRPAGQLDLGLGAPPPEPDYGERWARARGLRVLVGVDEVGRGPLAGPVVAAAVILPADLEPALLGAGLTDSKCLSAARRETLAAWIRREAWVGVGEVGPARIDEVNILEATFEAMRSALAEAVARAPRAPDCLLVDGNQPLCPSPLPAAVQKTLIQGDRRALCIAAASVIAKVHRDARMTDLDVLWPGYGFADHKGYPCARHAEALARLGPCAIHRRSFRGVLEVA